MLKVKTQRNLPTFLQDDRDGKVYSSFQMSTIAMQNKCAL